MTILRIIWDVAFIVLILLLIVLSVMGDLLEVPWILICLGIMGLAVWDLKKRLRVLRRKRELKRAEEEHGEVRKQV